MEIDWRTLSVVENLVNKVSLCVGEEDKLTDAEKVAFQVFLDRISMDVQELVRIGNLGRERFGKFSQVEIPK